MAAKRQPSASPIALIAIAALLCVAIIFSVLVVVGGGLVEWSLGGVTAGLLCTLAHRGG